MDTSATRLVARYWVAALFAAITTGCGSSGAAPSATSLVARAPEAGLIAIATRGSTTVRVLYARDGGMILLREVRLPPGDRVTGLALSADGVDLLIDSERSIYSVSTKPWTTGPGRSLAWGRDSASRIL